MSPKKEPTNSQLARIIEQQGLQHTSEITALSTVASETKTKVDNIERWMIGVIKVEEYKTSHPELPRESKLNKDLVKITLAFIGLATAIVAWKATS